MSVAIDLISTHIGSCARDWLDGSRRWVVIGNTSRGIFLQSGIGRVLALSNETYRGPLTINITGMEKTLLDILPGSEFTYKDGYLLLESGEIRLRLGSTPVWYAPFGASPTLAMAEIIRNVNQVLRGIQSQRGFSALGRGIQATLLGDDWEGDLPTLVGDPRLLNLHAVLISKDIFEMIAILETWLGLGEGLTPSGDDVVLGFLLTLNRWGDVFEATSGIRNANQILVIAAHKRTSNLSADLIECAARGQADERLIEALDGIITGNPGPPGCVGYLLDWGQSSGSDAFLGMALAILTQFGELNRSHN